MTPEDAVVRNPKPYLKVAALASSALLVAALVAYRAGAFESYFRKPPPAPAPVAAPQPGESEPEFAPTVVSPDGVPGFMYGSKSAPTFVPYPQTTPPADPAALPQVTQVNPAFIGGSKSTFIIPPGGVLPPPAAPSPGAQQGPPPVPPANPGK